MAEITEEPIEEQPKIKMSDFELSTYGEMYSQGAMVPMVVPPRRAEDGTPLDGEGEDGHNYSVALSDLDGRIRMYADAAIESSFDAIVAGAATAAEAQITDEVIRLVHVSMDEYIPGIEEAVMAQFPTKVSELENDAGYATTGVMNAALSHKQDIIPDLAGIRSGAEAGAAAVQPGDLATVATSGSYNDLENTPTIPAAQVNSDWNASSGVAEILHKPQLAAVATTGDYGDLSNTPSIPEPQVKSDWNANSGVAEILNKPELAPVATSGNYSDLAGKPAIPAKTSDLSNDSGFITAADVPVKGVTVNGSSAVNAQGIATITVPTATSALQNDSGFVGTQSAPSANQVLTFNGSAVVWADPQGGGGSDLPPITPSDEGKFLKVDSGSAVWGEGGGGGDDNVYVELGDIEAGIPVGQTEKWDEIAEHLVAGESVVGRVSSSSGKLDATPVTMYSFPWLMTALGVSTLAELKERCEAYGMLDILTILFGFEQDGATVKVDVTPADGIIPRYMMAGSTLEISEIGLNMDVSLRPTNVYRYEIQDNKYVPDIYGYLDDDVEELLRDIVSTCSTCKFTGWMGNTPGESTPSKFYGENIPAQIKLVDEPESGNTTIQIDVNGLVLKYDPNVSYSELHTLVPAMWRGEFEFTEKHDYNRYWQTKDTAFELATVNE